jgi:hypothetical protein
LFRSRVLRLPCAVFVACGLLVLGADRADAEEVLTSWYGPSYYGLPTASGEQYDASDYTASHETLPLGTELEVGYEGKSVLVTVNDRGDFPGERGLDLSQAAAQELGLTGPGVDYVEVGYPSAGARDGAPFGGYPSYVGGTGPGADSQAGLSIGVAESLPEPNHANGLTGYGTGSPDYPGGGSVTAPGTARGQANEEVLDPPQNGLPQNELSQNELHQNGLPQNEVSQNGLPQNGLSSGESMRGAGFGVATPYGANDLDFGAQPTEIATGAYPPVQPYGIDTGFIGRQEGFRLDAYVPDPGFSMSGVTVGTGVDIGQRSVADIQALDIPEGLKQKLIPYAGLKGQDAVNFLANRPLRLTEDEAYALDRAVARDIFGDVAVLYDADATGDSFLELPLEARTAIGDVAYQYGPNLKQRLPDFWGDVTQGRWDEATQTLKNFGDRYPVRRDEEAALLEQAIGRGDLASYLVQPGDTLSGVAFQRGISAEYLAARNGLADPDVIYGGQALYH